MTQNKETHSPEEGHVVYRRTDPSATAGQSGPRQGRGGENVPLAPGLLPLIMGFALLVLLVFGLGSFSVRKIDDTTRQVLEMGNAHAGSLKLLLGLRNALITLDNEARDRDEAITRHELRPPFDIRLSTARNEVNSELRYCERAQFAQTEKWRSFRSHLDTYLAVTDDSARYNQEGFDAFRLLAGELDGIVDVSLLEEGKILQRTEELQQSAARAIRFWTGLAILAGLLIALGTIVEIQRRFRQLRRTMHDARREREFSNQMLEGMVSAVAAIDARGHIRSANPAFFQMFPRASIGVTIYEKFAAEDAMTMLDSATATRVEKATYRGRWVRGVEAGAADGRTFDIYSSPLEIDGEHGQILTLVDVTEAAEAETNLRHGEALAAVGQATAQLAHEIRNPLGSIRLGVAMLRDSAPGLQSLTTIDLVERGINHLNKLVVDVTEFSRERPLELEETDLQELIESGVELVSDRVEDKNTELVFEYASKPIRGNWDADQLREVFMNLLGNAIDASEPGTQITIATELLSSQNSDADGPSEDDLERRGLRARIVIADRGHGIPEQTLARIFEPFFTTKRRGTGLGLAISRRIVERHGGKLTAESEVGKGTRFKVELPLQ
ncbi:MAG: two-component system, NtrC family, sensor histidine kinase HydH [Blastocatellia bacterium]|nr:two-component system, NtrC family, sensor histidine kinase HydH [Blastocatellia bacterium]